MNSDIEPSRIATWRAFQWANVVVMREMARRAEVLGVPLPWFDVLIHVHEAEGGKMRMQALSDSLVLSPSGLTRLMDRMEEAGLMVRAMSPEDRRGAYAVITPKGRETFERIWPDHEKDIEELFTSLLRDDEVPVLRDVFTRVIVGVEGPNSSYA